jgi:hypothetical protein
MIFSKSQKQLLTEPAVNKLVDNVRNIDTLMAANMIKLDADTFYLHTFCWHEKDATFRRNYVHSLSQYFILKNNGNDLPFRVMDTDNNPMAEYKPGGIVMLL